MMSSMVGNGKWRAAPGAWVTEVKETGGYHLDPKGELARHLCIPELLTLGLVEGSPSDYKQHCSLGEKSTGNYLVAEKWVQLNC